MALKRTFMIGVLLACGMLTSTTRGQNHTPGTFFERTPESSLDLPFSDGQGLFGHYDTQVFAPLEFTNGKEKAPNTGLFFELSKTYLSLERATRFNSGLGVQTSNGTEFYTGTRYELGWYGEQDRGWNAVFSKTEGTFFFNNRAGIFDQIMSEGNVRLTTVEVNRTFRQVTSKGGVFEPSLGLRYNWIRDRLRDNSIITGGATSFFGQNASNSAFGLQAGARFSKRHGRWPFTYRGNVAATYNQQRLEITDVIQGATNTFVELAFTDQSFVPILDGTLEATYNVTRDLSIKLGVQGSYIWNGILRANTEPTAFNGLSTSSDAGSPFFSTFDENYVAAGFVFGFEFRR